MTRYIDADALIEIFDKDEYDRVRNEYQSGYNDGLLHAEVVADDLADDMPTVDAVEVIRCKDCKYYREDGDCWYEWDNDGRIYYQSIINEPSPDDYCSRAERTEE